MTAASSPGQAAAPARKQQTHRRLRIGPPFAKASVLLLLTVVFALLGAGTAFGITRDTVLARAQTWVDNPVPYSQSRYFGGYRTDCSGYASMCWQTGTSWSTATFHAVTHRIAVDSLQPGDAMLIPGYHIRIFYGWVDAAHTHYVAYEQTGPSTKSSIKSMASDLAYGYTPTRYNGITDSPPSANSLHNGSFDVWASGDPVWWMASAPGTDTPVLRRKDVSKTARNSLELVNPSASSLAYAALEQTTPVTASTTYTLAAWARTSANPSGLEMRLRYLNASGATVTDVRTTGDVWGVGATAFKRMTLTSAVPAGAVTARVTMWLGGGVDASGTAGTTALLDDVSLARPQATITLATVATTAYSGRTVTLSGSVTPTTAVGVNIVVWVKKPGTSRWSYSSNRTVYALDGNAAWLYKYYFKPGMTKGVYTYRAECPALPGYLGATSPNTVGIRLR